MNLNYSFTLMSIENDLSKPVEERYNWYKGFNSKEEAVEYAKKDVEENQMSSYEIVDDPSKGFKHETAERLYLVIKGYVEMLGWSER